MAKTNRTRQTEQVHPLHLTSRDISVAAVRWYRAPHFPIDGRGNQAGRRISALDLNWALADGEHHSLAHEPPPPVPPAQIARPGRGQHQLRADRHRYLQVPAIADDLLPALLDFWGQLARLLKTQRHTRPPQKRARECHS